MYKISKKKMNSLFAKAQWKRRKTIIQLQKQGIENADKLLPKITKRDFAEVYLNIRQANKATGYKRNVLKDTINAFLQKRSYKQWKALQKGQWYKDLVAEDEEALQEAIEEGIDPSSIERRAINMMEFMYTEKGGRALEQSMSDYNEELKEQGITDSYKRKSMVGNKYFGSA